VVWLRGGTHRLTSTLHLGAADSGLSVVGFPGEKAVVSGAALITTPWTRVTDGVGVSAADSVGPSAAGPLCTLFDNTDVSGGNDLPPLGTITATAEDCVQLCQQQHGCRLGVGVWGAAGSVHKCYCKTDASSVETIGGHPGNVAFNSTPCPANIWKTRLAPSQADITGLLVDGVRAIRARYPNADPEVDKFPLGCVVACTNNREQTESLASSSFTSGKGGNEEKEKGCLFVCLFVFCFWGVGGGVGGKEGYGCEGDMTTLISLGRRPHEKMHPKGQI